MKQYCYSDGKQYCYSDGDTLYEYEVKDEIIYFSSHRRHNNSMYYPEWLEVADQDIKVSKETFYLFKFLDDDAKNK